MDKIISVLQFKTNGEWGVLEIPNTLEALQEAVGGYIEVVRIFSEIVLICDEEGRIKGKSINPYSNDIRGDFILCGTAGEEFRSLSDKEMKTMQEMLCGLHLYKCAKRGAAL